MLKSVIATANGPTEGILAESPEEGRVLIRVRNASGWTTESVAIEVSPTGDADDYDALEDSSGPVVITKNHSADVLSGLFYRLNVTGYAASDITLSLHRIGKDWERNRFR